MSTLATNTALWAAQNKLRGVRDSVQPLSLFGVVQPGTDPDELAESISVLGARPVDGASVSSTDFNLRDIYKDAGVWRFALEPFVIPPFIIPTVPTANWNGGLIGGRQTAPLDGAGRASTLWLNVVGTIERVEVGPGYWENKSSAFTITSATIQWQAYGWTPPAAPPIPGPGSQHVPFDWWAELMIPNTSVATNHPDYNKPTGNSAFEVNHGDREFYPPYMYI